MSKSNKPASSQKANEIKDLLLDVIQQEDSSISDTEVYRLSQPYKKSQAAPVATPHVDQDSGVDLNFAGKPLESKAKEKLDDEESAIKLDFDMKASDSEKTSPFNVKPSSQKPVGAFQSDKTIKLANAPQSRGPIELKNDEQSQSSSAMSSNEQTVRLAQKPKSRTLETESRVASGSTGTSSNLKFKPEVQIGISSPAEAVLKQSENLRVAQSRITSLEEELDRLRQQNSQLASAGDILRRRADELLSRSEGFESKLQESALIFDEEKKVLKAQIQNKDKDLEVRRQKVDQLEQRLNSQFDSIRRRERELEHRLEIMKIENQDILSGKDKMILDLKRQVDLLNNEANFSKERTQELYNQHKDKQETIRRVVKALRMALTILEGDEENQTPLKKVD